MTTAIGVVITDHIGAGRLQDQRLTGRLLRYPEDADELDSLSAIPSSELVELLATLIATLAAIDTCKLTPSVSPFPASSAMRWSRTRPISPRSRECTSPTS